MLQLEGFLQALNAGLLLGAHYGLMCVGLSLIFGVMRVINFAHGDFMMVGMYAAFHIFTLLGLGALLGEGAGPYVAALLAAPVLFVLGYLAQRFLVSRVTGTRVGNLEGEGHYAQLILTLGLSLILQSGGQILFGSVPVSVPSELSSEAWELEFAGGALVVFVNQARAWGAVVAVAIVTLLVLLITRSRTGKSLRAAADNVQAALYMGIDVDRAHRLTFGLGVAITAVAGGLLASSYPFTPYVGLEFVIIMYAGVVLGGLGSTVGAFWGGLLIGVIQQCSALLLPTQLQNTAIFAVFLLVVFLRPQGLLGRVSERT
ncbi:branched-chain amino acid ABC transporter permease [Teichococcus vastitatis]|uniref:Branched-chain amino acid ABC transporter permease n=1 Tax=Teichococcus vastitatis TaxID=2307076 RepID=A0ABS9W6U3_9PROT|nr:branched-chain amino acid ABC transporter permease [Pseudoroseomonas vastitatis]MCI0755013.1 branched-chain amino acid ABC transporter permease [Pseudoroseomonas vastitatis]